MFKKHVAISKELDCAVQVDTRVHVRACVKTSYNHFDHLLSMLHLPQLQSTTQWLD